MLIDFERRWLHFCRFGSTAIKFQRRARRHDTLKQFFCVVFLEFICGHVRAVVRAENGKVTFEGLQFSGDSREACLGGGPLPPPP